MARVEHRGYVIHQNDYNHHYMIGKDGKMVSHVPYYAPLSENELREKIELFIQIRDLLMEENDE